ncbi:hypothetical protein CY35_04G117300 [Sphagnum magellanicum]|nr:hypothetical protein CY35_04G117300 [Sphagnum magellanicum]
MEKPPRSMLNAGSLCGPCGIRFSIDLMQMICVEKVVLEKSLDDSIQEMTLIHHYFGGCPQSQVKCRQCLHESNRYEPMMDLLVDIQGNAKSVEDALAQFTDTKVWNGANKYKCDQEVHLDPGLYKVGKDGLQMAHPDGVTCRTLRVVCSKRWRPCSVTCSKDCDFGLLLFSFYQVQEKLKSSQRIEKYF